MKLTLIDTRRESPDVVSFFFEPDRAVSWQAGQFLNYTLPHPGVSARDIERYFPIASAASEGHIRLTTRLARKSSDFKDALRALRHGDSIEAGHPEGDFVIQDPTEEFVFVAGGLGIAPFRAMLIDLDHRDLPIHVNLIYVNPDEYFVYRDELEEIARRHPNFRIHYVKGLEGINERIVREAVPVIERPTYYMSIPESMARPAEALLRSLNVAPSHIRNEYFSDHDQELTVDPVLKPSSAAL